MSYRFVLHCLYQWRPPPTAQKFLNFMHFFTKFGEIICWRPLEDWRPLIRGILDPPLFMMHMNQSEVSTLPAGCNWARVGVSLELPLYYIALPYDVYPANFSSFFFQ